MHINPTFTNKHQHFPSRRHQTPTLTTSNQQGAFFSFKTPTFSIKTLGCHHHHHHHQGAIKHHPTLTFVMKRQQNTNIHHSRPTNTTLTSKTLSNTFHPKRFLYQNSFKHQHLSVKRHRMTVLTTEALTNNNQQKTVFIRHHFFLKWQLKKKKFTLKDH